MRKYIILLFLLFSAITSFAENASNIRVRQEGKAIVVTYDLSKNSVVRLLMASGNSTQYTELKAVTGNVGKGVSAGKDRQIVWKPLDEYEEFIARGVRFKVETMDSYDYYSQNAKIRTLVLGQVGIPVTSQLNYGVKIGQVYNYAFGWYVNGRSNFNFTPAELTCNAGGYIDGERPFYSGNRSITYYIINAGLLMACPISDNMFNTFGMYIGGGYGKREFKWETTDGLWVKDFAHTGFSGNLGFLFSIYGVTFEFGVNTINFEWCELEAGIGFMF